MESYKSRKTDRLFEQELKECSKCHKIKSCSKFDLSDLKQQELCFNFSNLQPLWQKDNLKKGSR